MVLASLTGVFLVADLVGVGVTVAPGAAATGPSTAVGVADPAPEVSNVAAAQRFLDEELPRYVDRFDVPGATASIVVPGGEVVSAAAGTADVATARELTADTPLRVASISKSFTAVAVLQLIEVGAFTFDTPVEQLLPDDVVLDRHDEWRVVTVGDLLTHTAGFEDRLAGTTTASGTPAPDLHSYLRHMQVRRIHAPGEVVSYSNYGFALLGLVVQTTSNEFFARRVNKTLFTPLGMSDTAFADPDDVAGLAVAHRRGEDGLRAAPAVGMAEFPAGGATSTARDMGKFMSWLLSEHHAPVLSETSAAGMLSRHAGTHPALPGSGWGTWERFVPGVQSTIIGHDGDLSGAHSAYVVLPDEGVGAFISVDGDPVDAVHDLRRAFLDDFVRRATCTQALPAIGADATVDVPDTTQPAAVPTVRSAVGTYVTSRRSVSDASALKVALDQVRVRGTAGGGLRTTSPALGTTDWAPSGVDVFVSADGQRLALLRDARGQVQGVGTSIVPTQTYLRVDALHDPFLHLAVASGGGVVGLLGVSTAVVFRMRQRRRSLLVRVGRGVRAASGLVVSSGVCVAVALFCLVIAAAAPEGVEDVIARRSLLLSLPFTVATVVSSAAVIVTGATAVVVVRPGAGGRWARVGDVLTALGWLSTCVVAVGYQLTLL